jgi:hypothetical protein
MVVMSQIQHLAKELRQKGEFDILKSSMTRADAQKLFARD